jgi:O-antigen ligase
VFGAVATIGVVITAAVVATRGTLLGMTAASLALPFVLLHLGGGRRVGILSACVALLGGISIIAAVVLLTPIGERVGSAGAESASRVALYVAAMRAARDRPVVGYGPDAFAVAFARYRRAEDARVLDSAYQNSAHNVFLQAAATSGIPGVMATLGLAVASVVGLWKRLSKADAMMVPIAAILLAHVAYLAHAFVAVGSITVDWVPWIALGAAARGSRVREVFQRRPGRFASAAIVIVVFGFA